MSQSFIVTAREGYHVADEDALHERIVGEGRSDRPRGWRLAERGLELRHVKDPRATRGQARRPTSAVAYVNHGRWVADCPTAGCGGAMLVLKGGEFLCGTCFNAEIGGEYRPIVWPDDAGEIESLLVVRPLPVHMNWRPGETLADLAAENDLLMGGN